MDINKYTQFKTGDILYNVSIEVNNIKPFVLIKVEQKRFSF